MTREQATEVFAAIHFTVVGLSHLLQPRAWVEFFIYLRGLGRTGAFINGMLSVAFGSVIVAFHNVWTWPGVVLTLVGWGQVLKGGVCLIAPSWGLRSLARVATERNYEFVAAGLFLLALAGVAWYSALSR